jgi:photosystem II stability/assembly factor-like uncharacterized protein
VNPSSSAPALALLPQEEYFLQKQNPSTIFPVQQYFKSMENVALFSKKSGNRTGGHWVVQGPGNIGARANTIAVDPKDTSVILIGFSDGGLFKTTNGGTDWIPVFDNQITLSIGDVVFDPNDSKTLYVGTGDPNISGFPFVGNGIYKSSDGGNSWRHLGLEQSRTISQIRVSKQDRNTIYVGAMGLPFEKNNHRGVFKSTNGGETWSQSLFVNDSTGVCDLALHPHNDKIIYAATWNRIRNNKVSLVAGPDAKIFKSIDGGANWRELHGGLPEDSSSRIGIDISESDPNILYACYTHPVTLNLRGIYKSVDGGESWTTLPLGSGLQASAYGAFGWYFGKIRINPKNPDDVFLLAVDLHRTTNGGLNWTMAAPSWATYHVHADKHDLIFSGNSIYLTTDGGAYTANLNNMVWRDIEHIPSTQFYRVAYNPHFPSNYYGGAQDNGTTGGNGSEIINWNRIYGGDGFQPIFHPTNPAIMYAETQNGGLVVSQNGGLNFSNASIGINGSDPRNWDMPFIMSYHNPDVLYTGTNKLYINENGASPSWKAISPDLTDPSSNFYRHNITAISESPLNPDYLCAGTSDGRTWISIDKGRTWLNVSAGLPSQYVSSVAFSPNDENTVYVSFTGYKDNDNTAYIFRSQNLGKSWETIQNNMPQIAVNNILVMPEKTSDNHIVLATDAGVFYTANAGKTWQRMGDNLPLVTVYDVDYNVKNNQIIAGTFGRSILTYDLSQIGYNGTVRTDDLTKYNFISLKYNILNEFTPFLTLTKNTPQALLYDIVNNFGNTVTSGILSDPLTQIEFPDAQKGLYFIKVYDHQRKKSQTLKFIYL